MEIKYRVMGEKRKQMVQIVSDFTGEPSVYLRVPSCAYRIGEYTVSKEGTLICDGEIPDGLIQSLREAGFTADTPEGRQTQCSRREPERIQEEPVPSTAGETGDWIISIPREMVNLENLNKLVDAKRKLLLKALGIRSLPVLEEDDRVIFPWCDTPEPEKLNAVMHLVSALCEFTKNAKRVTAVARDVENEKYAFRCFLLRLGFIGTQYKQERKILLKNLNGSSAFRD